MTKREQLYHDAQQCLDAFDKLSNYTHKELTFYKAAQELKKDYWKSYIRLIQEWSKT